MGIQEYLQEATGKGASDLFIVAGLPLTYKINRKMIRVGDRLMPEDTRKLIEDIYVIAQERKIETLEKNGDDDFSFSIPNLGRFRVSTYRQRGSLAAVIRLIAFRLPNPISDYAACRIQKGSCSCNRFRRKWKVYNTCLSD